MIWVQAIAYFGIAVFFLVVSVKFLKYLSMPLHLRWELYPVPHEKYRAKYGGSYYEETEWWKKPRETSFAGELKEMLLEMLFIKRAFEYNRRLWFLTFPFHAGIYLMLLWFALIFASAAFEVLGVGLDLTNAASIVFGIGVTLLIFGTTALLLNRAIDRKLRTYSSPVDYFNLLFILAVAVTGLLAMRADMEFQHAKAFAVSLITFTPTGELPAAVALHTALLSLLVAYIPNTKMSHFIAKYFTYHQVLWEDTPNLVNSPLRERIALHLGYKVKWSAPHIRADLTWAEEATAIEPVLEVRALAERRKRR
jgi:nitrate reductase gamma subunit